MSDSDTESTGSSSSGSSGSSESSGSSKASSKSSSKSADGVSTAFPTRRSSRKRVAPGSKKRIPDERLPMIARLQAACEVMKEKKADKVADVERTPTNHIVKYVLKNRDHLVTHGIITWNKANEYGKRGYVKIFLLDDFTEIDEVMMWDSKLLSLIKGRHMIVFVMNQRRDQGIRFHPDKHEHWLRQYSDGAVGSLSWCRISWDEVHAAARAIDAKSLKYDLVSEDDDSVEEDSDGHEGFVCDVPERKKSKKGKKIEDDDEDRNVYQMRPAEGGGYSMQVVGVNPSSDDDESFVSDPEYSDSDSSTAS